MELLEAKPAIPTGTLNLAVGEATLVKHALAQHFDIHEVPHLFTEDLDYPDPSGYQPLVELLQAKYGDRVLITNGAKQALGAVAYALVKMDKRTLGLATPYWCLFPPMMKAHNIYQCMTGKDRDLAQAQLVASPNNPDNHLLSAAQIETLKGLNVPIIHDAVYHNHIYLPATQQLHRFGNVRLYSASKAFGISGIRIGWAVCDDPDFYPLMREYIEMMTVGVSVPAQKLVYRLLKSMLEDDRRCSAFESTARNSLMRARYTFAEVDRSVLDIPSDFRQSNGMFGWFKCLRSEVLEKAKVLVPDGKHFGQEGYVRINLAVKPEILQQAVERINSAAKE
jgi:aspartate/methionine/tyrosine aminotransferase